MICIALALTALVASSCKPQVVFDPYEGVDWSSVLTLRAALHVHTAESTNFEWPDEGTTVTPAEQIDHYQELGYDVVALTDHDRISYPWSRFGREDSPMVAVKGIELSKNDNLVSLFNDYEDHTGEGCWVSDGFEGCIQNVQDRDGVIYLAHPMRNGDICRAGFCDSIFLKYPCVYGMEVLNVGQFGRNMSIDLWDQVLSDLMPGRHVFGSSSDDSHSTSMSGKGWTYILATERTSDEVRRALTTGTTYFSTPLMVENPEGPVPMINGIVLDRKANTITIDASNCSQIEWTSMGEVVAEGETLNYTKTSGIDRYVRATLTGKGGKTYTQAWGIK